MVADDAVARRGSAGAVRRRPRDRKAQILRAAAVAFSAHGYHSVGVNDIAAELGISGPALYRHFPNKYALFVATAEAAAQSLLAAVACADIGPAGPAAERLDSVLRALIAMTIAERAGGGIYRWERRYLEQADRTRLRAAYDSVNAHVAEPLAALRPELPAVDVAVLAAAALSVIGSITAHHATMATGRLADLLDEGCWSVLRCDLPVASPPGTDPTAAAGAPIDADPAALLLDAAVRIVAARGYHEASMEEIAAAAGMNASGVYRHYASKADLLAAVLYRASDRLTLEAEAARSESADARVALLRLADRYVALAFSQPELLTVYFAEFSNLPDAERSRLRTLQRRHVRDWAALVSQARAAAGKRDDAVEAQFRVHAALGLVLDLGRLTHFDNRPDNRARVHRLMQAVLLQ